MMIFYDEEKKEEMKLNINIGLSNLKGCISIVSHSFFNDEFKHELDNYELELQILKTLEESFDDAIKYGEDIEITGNSFLLVMRWRNFDLDSFVKGWRWYHG